MQTEAPVCVSAPLNCDISCNHAHINSTKSLSSTNSLGRQKKIIKRCARQCVCVHARVCACVGAHLCFHEAMPSQGNYSLCYDMLIMAERTMHTLSERMQKLLWQRGKARTRWTELFFSSAHFHYQVSGPSNRNGPTGSCEGSYCCINMQLEVQNLQVNTQQELSDTQDAELWWLMGEKHWSQSMSTTTFD